MISIEPQILKFQSVTTASQGEDRHGSNP